jgi:hypothetical protein
VGQAIVSSSFDMLADLNACKHRLRRIVRASEGSD